jgi:SAM-dependent methyltransferase
MELADVARNWDTLGRTDPLWAVISAPEKKFGRWDPGEFFASGRAEVDAVMRRIRSVCAVHELMQDREVQSRRALDFGCGVGRLTQALAAYYDHCDGVDIALSMIDWAQRYNQLGDRCEYHLNTGTDLRLFADATFDLVYSTHALQYLEREYAEDYVEEFIRVAAPGGLVLFELTTEPMQGIDGALPDNGFQVALSTTTRLGRLAPGQRAIVRVGIRNDGPATLPAIGTDGWFQVGLGNHWIDADGHRIIDDGRAPLSRDLPPGGQATLELEIIAPADPGRYTLEIDCVQEGVAWFADKGSDPISLTVSVADGTSLRSRLRDVTTRHPTQQPQLDRDLRRARKEMFGSSEAEVAGWVEAAGGTVLSVFDWDEISGTRSHDWQRRGFLCTR